MARIFKQKYTGTKDGRKVTKQSRKWYIEFVDADGVRRRVPAFADKAATQQLAARLEREAEQRKAGLIDRYAEHRKRSLTEHVDEWRASLLAKGTTDKHATLVATRTRRVFEDCKFTFWTDLSASKAQACIADLKDKRRQGDPRPVSQQTMNFHLQAVKQFCAWMVMDGRAPENPLSHLRGGNVRTDRRHDRRALAADELIRLLVATR